jgi:hypothetical protein
MQKKKTYRYSTGESFEADAEDLKRLLLENQGYLDNYLELYGSLEDDEYVARGNGFCDRKFSDDFIEGQIAKYRARTAELDAWLSAAQR